MSTPPDCQSVGVFAFRGDRSPGSAVRFQQLLDDERNGRGPSPSVQDCLLYAGHTGVSVDGGSVILAFNPDPSGTPVWQMMDNLKNGRAFPGIVRDDTTIFRQARSRSLSIITYQIVVPDPVFQAFKQSLDKERSASQYTYGFPNGDGDCNCTTWLERMGLPLLSGRIDEFVALSGINMYPSRRFGECV